MRGESDFVVNLERSLRLRCAMAEYAEFHYPSYHIFLCGMFYYYIESCFSRDGVLLGSLV